MLNINVSKMKKSLRILVSILFLSLSVNGQNFEGKITYKNKYQSKISGVSDGDLTAMMGANQDFYIKEGNYKSILKGDYLEWQLYSNIDNRVYNKLTNSPIAFWNDCSLNTDEILSVSINRKATEILGRKCDEYIFICKSGTQRYYFDNDLKINVDLYKNHNYANWYKIITESSSLPLKIVIENDQFVFESEATNIEKMVLEDSFFSLPEGMQIQQSPN